MPLKLPLINPWVVLGIAAAFVVSNGIVAWKSWHMGQDALIAEKYKLEEVERRTREAATTAAADAISKIEVKHVTLRQQAETVVREVPVYRDCRHDPDVMRNYVESFAPPVSAGPGELPGARTPD